MNVDNAVAIDVTDLSEKEIDRLNEAPKIEGQLKDGILYPKDFKTGEEKVVIRCKGTKKNKEIYSKYGTNGFKRDGTFNYSKWNDADLIKELVNRKDKGTSKKRSNFMKILGEKKLLKLDRVLAGTHHKESTKTKLSLAINKYIRNGDPKYIAKLKKKQKKQKEERAAIRREKALDKIQKSIGPENLI